jgi:hypothetical protein
VFRCPRCHARLEQPIRVVAQTGEGVARTETITPELAVVCSGCQALAIVAFYPTAAA